MKRCKNIPYTLNHGKHLSRYPQRTCRAICHAISFRGCSKMRQDAGAASRYPRDTETRVKNSRKGAGRPVETDDRVSVESQVSFHPFPRQKEDSRCNRDSSERANRRTNGEKKGADKQGETARQQRKRERKKLRQRGGCKGEG